MALAPHPPGCGSTSSVGSPVSGWVSASEVEQTETKLPAVRRSGNAGASAIKDGEHGLVSVGDGETYVIPVEVAEQRYGIRVERFGFNIVEGAGAGRRRGGRGLVREYRVLCDEALLTVAWGRHSFPPWGVADGRDGSPNYVEVLRAGGREAQRFGKASRVSLHRGDLIRLVTGTGGGYGDPRERETPLVLADLHDEIISVREATEIYGVPAIGAGRGAGRPGPPPGRASSAERNE